MYIYIYMSLCLPPSTPHRFYTHLLSIHTHTIFNLGSITPCMGFPGGSDGEESTCNAGDLGSIPAWEDTLEKRTATHSNILAWRTPWTI